MRNLFIMGSPGSGKTAVALGMAQKLQKEGYAVGYFKPVANGRKPGHSDANLMKQVLGMEAPLDKIAPFTAGPSYLTGYRQMGNVLETINEAYQEVSRDYDVMLIDGAFHPYVLGSCGLDSPSLARQFNASALVVIKIEDDYSLDRAVLYNRYLEHEGIPIAGNIFSNVSRPLYAKTEGIMKPILAEMGFKTIGVIPSRAEIASPTVAEYHEILGGEILAGEEYTDRLVEDVVIGAMTVDSALSYLRRTANKAVVLGGDRADIALAALETNTSVLILTGGLYPDVKVIARAADKCVPIILVHCDTYTTIEKLGQISRQIRPGDQASIRVALENIDEYCDWEILREEING